ncbi:MAG: NAD-dependent epimerase/dehydratase family protein [Thermoanaerobaculia bacterium]
MVKETASRSPSRKRSARAPRASRPEGRVVDFTVPRKKTKVALTGASGLLGSHLVKTLASSGTYDVVVFDLVPPAESSTEIKHRFVDLNLPHADGMVLKLLKEERPDVIVHLAALRSPSREATYAHELNSIGALHVLAAAGEAGVSRIVLGSTTMVYGARGDNPNFLSEEHPLRPDPEDRFVRDFVEAESHARNHVRQHPDSRVAVLRFAPILAPDARDYRAKLLESPFVVTLMGYDPLLQFLDPTDAVDAILRVLETPEAKGVFNISPDGVVPLSTAFLLYGTLGIPIPHPIAYPLIEAAWLAGLGLFPGAHAHYLRYLCVTENAKAKRVLGWEPRQTSLVTLLATARVRRGKGRAIDFDVLSDVARTAAYRYEQHVKGAGHAPPAPRGAAAGAASGPGHSPGPRRVS